MTAGLATAAIGNGLAFVVLVYATAGISGGHLNPAISTAFVVTGRWRCLAPSPCPPVPCGACLRVCLRRRPALRVLTRRHRPQQAGEATIRVLLCGASVGRHLRRSGAQAGAATSHG